MVEIRREAPLVATIGMDVPGWPEHLAGQHLDLRLTAPDGYQAQRSYSVASAPGNGALEITVEQVPDGEVSSFLLEELIVGDTLELRGPIGGYFTWQPGRGVPLLLVAGGSGIVPLMAMLRHRVKLGDPTPTRLLYSARTYDTLIYREELERLASIGDGFVPTYALTRSQPTGWRGERRRIDRTMLEAFGFPADVEPEAYVCGPTSLVEALAGELGAMGYVEARIRTERFGPTGGTG